MADSVRVLSIDGGGIRGIIPSRVIAELETLADRPAAELFDVIVGTSTGGILGLVVPGQGGAPKYSAADLGALYPQWGKSIFPAGGPRTLKERRLGRGEAFFDRMMNGARAVGAPFGGNPRFGGNARHMPEGLEATLTNYFGDVRMADAITDIVVTSFDSTNRQPVLFSRSEAQKDAGLNFEMRDVARATSAAPTFFPPKQLPLAGGKEVDLVDGGVWANNPVSIAYQEGVRITIERGLTADRLVVVSVGTGVPAKPGSIFNSKGSWLGSFGGLAQLATDTSVDDVLLKRQLDALGPQHYWRFQSTAAGAAGHMDDPTPDRIKVLTDAAEALVTERAADLRQVANALTETM